jgi:3-methyl-2-oxobutanoate hydroxymethyltransferase
MKKQQKKLIEDAKRLEDAGVFAIVLECIPAKLAEIITKEVSVPTIGIGAGACCDGQILVYQDMLNMFGDFKPKFVKTFANVGETITKGVKKYMEEVENSQFPAEEHCFNIKEETLKKLY